jgi:hypothetical protein
MCSAVPFCTVCPVLYRSVLYVQYCTVLYCMCSTVPFCTLCAVLYRSVLYVQCCTVLYCMCSAVPFSNLCAVLYSIPQIPARPVPHPIANQYMSMVPAECTNCVYFAKISWLKRCRKGRRENGDTINLILFPKQEQQVTTAAHCLRCPQCLQN